MKTHSAELLAALEGDASPLAVAPRHVDAVSTVLRVLRDALVAAGYEPTRAEELAVRLTELLQAER